MLELAIDVPACLIRFAFSLLLAEIIIVSRFRSIEKYPLKLRQSVRQRLFVEDFPLNRCWQRAGEMRQQDFNRMAVHCIPGFVREPLVD